RSHEIDKVLAEHRQRRSSPRGPLGEREYNIVLHPWSRGAHYDLFARLGESLGRVVGPKLDRFNVEEEDLIPSSSPLVEAVDRMARALGIGTPTLYYHPSKDLAVGVAFSPNNAMVLGEAVYDDKFEQAHRFRVAEGL